MKISIFGLIERWIEGREESDHVKRVLGKGVGKIKEKFKSRIKFYNLNGFKKQTICGFFKVSNAHNC